jgi:hypothetical protein
MRSLAAHRKLKAYCSFLKPSVLTSLYSVGVSSLEHPTKIIRHRVCNNNILLDAEQLVSFFSRLKINFFMENYLLIVPKNFKVCKSKEDISFIE